MMVAIKRLWRQNRLLLMAFVLACALTVFFGGRMVLNAIYWGDPMHRDQPIAGWMTPRYIAHSWHVPPEVVLDALEIEPKRTKAKPPTLASIAEKRGEPLPELERRIEEAIAGFRERKP
ncbi:hypothetical protein [Amaricoccus macauensis]|uniref:hypothetical protein n=1 Tax=Amaricoccus macauensis TaxID=57001 RepID=UPI003C7C329D